MKKYFLILLATAALLSSCGKESTEKGGKQVNANFTAGFTASSKAAIVDGQAAKINRCILQIWMGDKIYKTIVKTAASGTKEYKFENIPLVADQTYDFLFWADCADGSNDKYYTTSSLKNVSLKDITVGNTDSLDAFCNQPEDSLASGQKLIGQLITTGFTKSVVLRRPLAQLNVYATDIEDINGLDLASELKPVKVSYSYSGCTGFNVYSNQYIGEPQTINISDKPVYDYDGSGKLMMNYVLPADGYSVTNVSLVCKSASGIEVSNSWDNVNLKRNYKTNIRGNVLTRKGSFEIVINANWNQPDYEKE